MGHQFPDSTDLLSTFGTKKDTRKILLALTLLQHIFLCGEWIDFLCIFVCYISSFWEQGGEKNCNLHRHLHKNQKSQLSVILLDIENNAIETAIAKDRKLKSFSLVFDPSRIIRWFARSENIFLRGARIQSYWWGLKLVSIVFSSPSLLRVNILALRKLL